MFEVRLLFLVLSFTSAIYVAVLGLLLNFRGFKKMFWYVRSIGMLSGVCACGGEEPKTLFCDIVNKSQRFILKVKLYISAIGRKLVDYKEP